jgi:hypothetical protein
LTQKRKVEKEELKNPIFIKTYADFENYRNSKNEKENLL